MCVHPSHALTHVHVSLCRFEDQVQQDVGSDLEEEYARYMYLNTVCIIGSRQ